MTFFNELQSKIDQLIPYIWERFIELDFEYDFAPTIRFHLFKENGFKIPEKYKERIDIEEIRELESIDFDKLKEKHWKNFIQNIDFLKDFPMKESEKKRILFITRRREVEAWRCIDSIDFLLDKTIEFVKEFGDSKK